jgi:hypothetical protein
VLLATGRYADEEVLTVAAAGFAVPDSKRGFPQPPVAVIEDEAIGGKKAARGERTRAGK